MLRVYEGWERLLTLAEAQSEDNGRKMAQSVRTLEDIAGLSTTYWRIEKIAAIDVSSRLLQIIIGVAYLG